MSSRQGEREGEEPVVLPGGHPSISPSLLGHENQENPSPHRDVYHERGQDGEKAGVPLPTPPERSRSLLTSILMTVKSGTGGS